MLRLCHRARRGTSRPLGWFTHERAQQQGICSMARWRPGIICRGMRRWRQTRPRTIPWNAPRPRSTSAMPLAMRAAVAHSAAASISTAPTNGAANEN